ncbi:MAG: flagellar biosynthetic protein FliR [Albidovulum sp.]
MNAELAALFEVWRGQAILAAIVFLRMGAVMALLPGFGEKIVPTRIRLVLALAFTAIVTPAVAPGLQDLITDQVSFVKLLLCETLIGLALGFILRLFVIALEMAGSLAAQSGSLSQMFGAGGEPMPAISHLLVMSGLCLAFMTGLHVRLAGALILSYDALPAGVFPGVALMRDWSLGHIGQSFALAFSLAAPFVIAAFVYNIALGVINRAMPSLMVSFVGAPALTAGALILLAIAAPLMLSVWMGAFSVFLADPFTVPR